MCIKLGNLRNSKLVYLVYNDPFQPLSPLLSIHLSGSEGGRSESLKHDLEGNAGSGLLLVNKARKEDVQRRQGGTVFGELLENTYH